MRLFCPPLFERMYHGLTVLVRKDVRSLPLSRVLFGVLIEHFVRRRHLRCVDVCVQPFVRESASYGELPFWPIHASGISRSRSRS